ncbi:MAG: FxsA family protein [Bauldia sp.]
MRFRIIPLVLVILALVEIAVFILVGRAIGVAATLGLVLLAAIAGIVLMRSQGFGVMRRIREDVNGGIMPGAALADGAMILLAGVLLIIPGFVTDVIGLLLFLPAVRRGLRAAAMPGIVATAAGGNWQRWPQTPSPRSRYLDLRAEPPANDPEPRSR